MSALHINVFCSRFCRNLHFGSGPTTSAILSVRLNHGHNCIIFTRKNTFVDSKPLLVKRYFGYGKRFIPRKRNQRKPTNKHPNNDAANTKTAADSVRTTFTYLTSIWKKNWRMIFTRVPLFLVLCCLNPFSVRSPMGTSMKPTISPMGDVFLIRIKSPLLFFLFPKKEHFNVGDLVLFAEPNAINAQQSPNVSSMTLSIKRVVGVGGYVFETTSFPGYRDAEPETVIVPDDHLWVEGDNPDYSLDSRHYGPVSINTNVRGKVILQLWPLEKVGFVRQRP